MTYGQTRIREDERVPGQCELETPMSNTRPVRTAGDNEEEDGKTPEPDAHPIRHDNGYNAGHLTNAHKVLRYTSWEILCHGDDTRDREA